eukprot:967107_1
MASSRNQLINRDQLIEVYGSYEIPSSHSQSSEWDESGPSNRDEEKEDVSQDDMLAKLRSEKIIVGKMKPFKFNLNNNLFDENTIEYLVIQLGYKLNENKTELAVFGQEALDWKFSKMDGGFDIKLKQFQAAAKWEADKWKLTLVKQNEQKNNNNNDDDNNDVDVNMESNVGGHQITEIVQLEFYNTDEEWQGVLNNMRDGDKIILNSIEKFHLENGDGELDLVACFKICYCEKFDE